MRASRAAARATAGAEGRGRRRWATSRGRSAAALAAFVLGAAGCGDDGQGATDLDLGITSGGADASLTSLPVDLGAAADARDADVVPPPPLEALGGAQGLGTPVLDASPDEAGNLWAVTPEALYVRRAGQARFRRYTNADGLHIDTTILSVAGAGPDEGYLGLLGIETGNEDDAPAIRTPGKAERVRLQPDDTLRTTHYSGIHTDVSANFWITRSAYRLLYVHDGPAAGHLFMGGNHGITHIFDDRWGDHVHVEVYYLPERSGTYGLWQGLALDPATGGLWTCGKNACGLQSWDPDPRAWVNGKYTYAFTVFTGDHALEVPHGYREDFVGAAVTPDGTAWFLSAPFGLAAWKPNGFDYQNIRPVAVPGLGAPVDVAAHPDGTLYLADREKLLRFHPDTGAAEQIPLPGSDLRRLYLDARARPPALYVSTGDGLFVLRP